MKNSAHEWRGAARVENDLVERARSRDREVAKGSRTPEIRARGGLTEFFNRIHPKLPYCAAIPALIAAVYEART